MCILEVSVQRLLLVYTISDILTKTHIFKLNAQMIDNALVVITKINILFDNKLILLSSTRIYNAMKFAVTETLRKLIYEAALKSLFFRA